jgi:MFS family permease
MRAPKLRRLPGASALTDITPLRVSPPFRRLFTGSVLSIVGSSLTSFAIPLQVYDITRSPFAVGAIGLASLVPTLVIGLFGGSLIDAVERRKLVLITSTCLAGVSALLAAQAFAGLSVVWILYALVVVQSGLSAVNTPARRTFVPSLLGKDLLAAGLALNRIGFQVALIVGPALAGLITAAAGGHLQACYLIDAVSFGGALYGVAGLPKMPPLADVARPGLRAVAEGLQFIRRSQVLAGTFLADLNATVLALPVALFPAINAERFGGNPTTLGLFISAIGFGGVVSSAFTGPLRKVSRPGLVMLVTVSIWGAAFAGFALARSLWLTLALLAVAGAADTFSVVLRGAIVQMVTTDALRGRLTSAEYVIGFGGDSLGGLESGALGSLTSPVISALSGGIATVVLSVVLGLALPKFAAYRASTDAQAGPAGNEPADERPADDLPARDGPAREGPAHEGPAHEAPAT